MELYQFKTNKEIKIGNEVVRPNKYILLTKSSIKLIKELDLKENNIVLMNVIRSHNQLDDELNVDEINKTSIPFAIENSQLATIYIEKMFWLNYINIYNLDGDDIVKNNISIVLALEDKNNNKTIEIYPLYRQKPKLSLSKKISNLFLLDHEYMYIGNNFCFKGITIDTITSNINTDNILIEYPVKARRRTTWKVVSNFKTINNSILFSSMNEWGKINISDKNFYTIRIKLIKGKLEIADINIISDIIDLSDNYKLYDQGILHIGTNYNNIITGSINVFLT